MNLRLALFSTLLIAAFAIIIPWAVGFKKFIHTPSGISYTWGMGIFAGLFVLGFIWAIRKDFFN